MELYFVDDSISYFSWFFQGLADFGRVVLKNTAVKLVSVVLILLWVKNPGDLWKYLLIMSVSTMLGSFVFWFDIHRYVGKPVKHFYKYQTSIKAIITLLIPQIATQIYTSLDKPILGFFQNSTQVSFYDGFRGDYEYFPGNYAQDGE
mgnify:CR=1 FL=1